MSDDNWEIIKILRHCQKDLRELENADEEIIEQTVEKLNKIISEL